MKYYPAEGEYVPPNCAFYEANAERAWVHHFTHNPHHPEYWVRVDPDTREVTCSPMRPIYVIEMLLDWTAMGKVFGDTAYTYWNKNRDTKRMHPDTIDMVDMYVEYVKDGL